MFYKRTFCRIIYSRFMNQCNFTCIIQVPVYIIYSLNLNQSNFTDNQQILTSSNLENNIIEKSGEVSIKVILNLNEQFSCTLMTSFTRFHVSFVQCCHGYQEDVYTKLQQLLRITRCDNVSCNAKQESMYGSTDTSAFFPTFKWLFK